MSLSNFLKIACAIITVSGVAFGTLVGGMAAASDRFITIASTTSTRNSGLYNFILPRFTKATGISVRIIAVGTGQAIRLAKAGDADILFVHHQPSEEAFVREGYGVRRVEVMYNDFIIVGPKGDPAGVYQEKNVVTALKFIARSKSLFASRGDNSGTHKKELSLWDLTGISVKREGSGWYRQTGSGMGATLNTASAMEAYALSDRGTWLNFANKGNLIILSEGDKRLLNPYGVIRVNPRKYPHVKSQDAQVFIDWVISEAGQKSISAYTINGHQAFFPRIEPTK